jgi:mRNA interferase MazF
LVDTHACDDLWLVDFGAKHPEEPVSRRPALVIGPPTTFGPRFPFVVVAPLTTGRRGLSLHIEVEATVDTGLAEISYLQCEFIRSVNRDRLVHHIGTVDSETSRWVATVVRTLLNY